MVIMSVVNVEHTEVIVSVKTNKNMTPKEFLEDLCFDDPKEWKGYRNITPKEWMSIMEDYHQVKLESFTQFLFEKEYLVRRSVDEAIEEHENHKRQ